MEQLLKDVNNFENGAVRRKALAAVIKMSLLQRIVDPAKP